MNWLRFFAAATAARRFAKSGPVFADELALLQPTPGYMRLLKESVLRIWKRTTPAVPTTVLSEQSRSTEIDLFEPA